jgi:adenosylhomocysteine nucleosidase
MGGFAATSSGADAYTTAGPIGILGIPEETAQLVASLKNPEERSLGGIRVILGKLANQSVVLCQVGVGKVNAGMAAALLIQKFLPSAIIFTGNAGALNPNCIQGDVVLATDLAEYDFGQLSNGSFAPWQTRSPISRINNPLWFHPAPWLLSAARKSVPSVQLIRADTRPDVRDPKIFEGAIITGDTFVSDASKGQELRTHFNADGVEMEGAAVAQICSQYGTPLLVIRSITDRADGSSFTDYHNFVRIAAQNSSAFVIAILSQLQSQGHGPTISPKEVDHWLLAFELAFSKGSPYAVEFGDLHTLPYDVNEQISSVVKNIQIQGSRFLQSLRKSKREKGHAFLPSSRLISVEAKWLGPAERRRRELRPRNTPFLVRRSNHRRGADVTNSRATADKALFSRR